MALTSEQLKEVKEQLFKQLESVEYDKRIAIKQQIELMSDKEFELFLKKNKLIGKNTQCIFCSISQNKIPSFKISQSNENIAILEINPLSKGHCLIVPKSHSSPISEESLKFAQQTANLIKEKLKPKELKISQTNITGHNVIELTPIYGNETQRKQASEQELLELQKILTQKSEIKQNKEEKQTRQQTQKQQIQNKDFDEHCIYCLISNKKMHSIKIAENKDNLAVLDINPVSKAHILVLPKKHSELYKIPSSAFTLAKKIARKIKTKLKPLDIKIISSTKNNHNLIEIIPIYQDTDLNKKIKASESELLSLAKILEIKDKIKALKQPKAEPETKSEQQKQTEPEIIEKPKQETPSTLYKMKMRRA